MSNKSEKRTYPENSFLHNWLKRSKESSDQSTSANEIINDNDMQYHSLNESQQMISAGTCLTTNITSVAPLLSEPESDSFLLEHQKVFYSLNISFL